jgi:hypothetical protein
MILKLNEKEVRIVVAALIELDLRWRRGTANAGFGDRTIHLLRGPGENITESDVNFLCERIERKAYNQPKENES